MRETERDRERQRQTGRQTRERERCIITDDRFSFCTAAPKESSHHHLIEREQVRNIELCGRKRNGKSQMNCVLD